MNKVRIKLLYIILFLQVASGMFAQSENWPGYEGGNLHQNSSTFEINPSTLGVLWKRNFDKIITLTNAWSYCKPDGNYGSRNLVITNGYIPVVAYDGNLYPSNFSFDKIGYVTILNSKTGKTVNMFKATIADGPRHCNADGSDDVRGMAVLHWDAKTNFLFIMNGGDGSGFTAYSPLKNQSSYQFGMVQNGIGAFQGRPSYKDQVYPTPGPNETSFFEVDPDYPFLCYASGTHSSTASVRYCQKYRGEGLSANLENFPAEPFAKWGSVVSGNKRIFGISPVDKINNKGLFIWGYDITWKDNTPHGLDSLIDFDFMQFDSAFSYRVDTKSNINKESYNEYDGTYRNKALLIDGKGVWTAWKPDKANDVELIYCDDNGIEKYNLGIGAGSLGQNIWPDMSLIITGGKKYIVYYGATADTDSKLAIFDATSKALKWSYNISANYPGLPKSPLACYNDNSQMIVTGKYAYVGWVDLQNPTAYLNLLSFDITASSASPVLKSFPLGFSSTIYKKSYVTDLAAVNGIMYALITQSDLLGGALWQNYTSKWQAQYIYALSKADITPPSKPSTFFASTISTTYVNLSWTPAEDSVGVYYNIYKDGNLLSYTQDTTYKAVGLLNGNTYQFILEPVDLAGNIGTKDTLVVTTGNFSGLNSSQIKFLIFPNPAKDIITITAEESMDRIIITDITGRKIMEKNCINDRSTTIDIQQVIQGLYMVTVFYSQSQMTSKFIKE